MSTWTCVKVIEAHIYLVRNSRYKVKVRHEEVAVCFVLYGWMWWDMLWYHKRTRIILGIKNTYSGLPCQFRNGIYLKPEPHGLRLRRRLVYQFQAINWTVVCFSRSLWRQRVRAKHSLLSIFVSHWLTFALKCGWTETPNLTNMNLCNLKPIRHSTWSTKWFTYK